MTKSNNKYNYYFYASLLTIVVILLFKADSSLSISYKEALNVFVNNSVLSIISKLSISIFGQNDIALRLPFIIFYTLSVLLMYKLTENYFRYEKDRFIAICIFMILPGVISASLLVNSAIMVIFFTLLYLYMYQKNARQSYLLLIFFLFVDNSFAILYLALFFYSFKNQDKKLMYFSMIFFILSIYIYGFATDGKPRGFLVDTVAIYATVFSPLLFIYFVFSLYRVGIKGERTLAWYISMTAMILSIVFSFRQRVYIEDFGPFVVIALPFMLKIFFHSYRVRLKEFRQTHNIIAVLIVLMLLINIVLTFINKPLYLVLGNPTKHFVYQYHFAKELSEELKKRDINEITCSDKELQLRLKFYNINEGENYFISTRPYYNYDEKIVIRYYNKELLDVYVKKINP